MRRYPPLVIAAVLLGSLSCAEMQRARQAKADEFQRTIPQCVSEKDCERKWAAAQSWVVAHSAWKIQTATSSLIETYNPTDGSTSPAFRVVKEPIGSDGYRFAVLVSCANIFGCTPDTWDLAVDFNRTVNAVVTADASTH